jgi:hypothetical protein
VNQGSIKGTTFIGSNKAGCTRLTSTLGTEGNCPGPVTLSATDILLQPVGRDNTQRNQVNRRGEEEKRRRGEEEKRRRGEEEKRLRSIFRAVLGPIDHARSQLSMNCSRFLT